MVWTIVALEAVSFTVLFAHWKIFRLPGTEHKEYAQKWFHVKGMLFPGSLFLVSISALTGLIVSLVK